MNPLNFIIILICLIVSTQISRATNEQQKHVADFLEKYDDHDFKVFQGYSATQRGVTFTHLGEAVVVRVGRSDSNLPYFPAFSVDVKTGKVVHDKYDMPCDTNGIPCLDEQEIQQYGRVAEKIWEYHALFIGVNEKGVVSILLYDPKRTHLIKLPSDMKPEDYFKSEPAKGFKRRKVGDWYWFEKVENKESNQQVEPIVTTPVDKVEAQGTQAHP